MKSFLRANAPVFLAENDLKWGQEWKERREKKSNAQFRWPKHDEQPINKILLSLLANQTQWHCSYCDCNEIGSKEESIDHFRPSSNSAFYHLAFAWSNLYYVCWNCQKSKMETWSDDSPLIAPDEPDYLFEYYFIYNFRTGEIDPNPKRTAAEKARAEFTITTFGLRDQQKHCLGRKRALEAYYAKSANPNFNLDDHPYRYLFAIL